MKILPHLFLRSVLALVLVALIGCAASIKPAPAKRSGFSLYSFDKYGLSIETPTAWKMKTRGKRSGASSFLGGGPRGYFRNKHAPLKFIMSAHEYPYRGQSEHRSYATCSVTNASYASAKTVLGGTRKMYSMYPGGLPRGVRMTQIKQRKVGGKTAYGYKITLEPRGKSPGGTLEVISVKHRQTVLVCQGLYTYTKSNKAKVQHALRSIRLF